MSTATIPNWRGRPPAGFPGINGAENLHRKPSIFPWRSWWVPVFVSLKPIHWPHDIGLVWVSIMPKLIINQLGFSSHCSYVVSLLISTYIAIFQYVSKAVVNHPQFYYRSWYKPSKLLVVHCRFTNMTTIWVFPQIGVPLNPFEWDFPL